MTIERIEYDPPVKTVIAKLRAAGDEFPKRLRDVHKELADDVAAEGRARYARYYRRRTGAGEKSIRAKATQRDASIAIGNARAPYTAGQNFGSNYITRFYPKAEPDRFVYAVLEDMRDDIERRHREMVDDVLHDAYPEGSGI